MAISKKDIALAATGGGMFLGGQVANKTTGGSGPVGAAASVGSYSGTALLGFVGASEMVEQMGSGSKIQMMKYGQDIKKFGGSISSSARRAAPGLKLLAGRIAQGANKVI